MSNLLEIVADLERKVDVLLQERSALLSQRAELLEANTKLQQQIAEQKDEMGRLKSQYGSLKVAQTIVGSKEDKHLTKLRINTLIREIDRCIVQLSD